MERALIEKVLIEKKLTAAHKGSQKKSPHANKHGGMLHVQCELLGAHRAPKYSLKRVRGDEPARHHHHDDGVVHAQGRYLR